MTTEHLRLAAIRELADQLPDCFEDEALMLGCVLERLKEVREPAAARDPDAPRDLARERRRALIDALFLDVMDEQRQRREAALREAAAYGEPQQTVISPRPVNLAKAVEAGKLRVDSGRHDIPELARGGKR
jgi:hypothetical protein